MNERAYHLEYNAQLPIPLGDDHFENWEEDSGGESLPDLTKDMYYLNEERAVKQAIDQIRGALKFLKEQTDVTWWIEETGTQWKFAGDIPIYSLRFYDQLNPSAEPIDTISEDEE